MAYIKINKSKIDRVEVLCVDGGINYIDIMKKYNPDYLINGALYDVSTSKNIVRLVSNGVKSGYLFADNGIDFDKLTFSTIDKCKNYIAGAPVLVKNGNKSIEWGNKVSEQIQGSKYRSCIGIDNDSLYLLASDNTNTLDGLADYCIKQGMQYAINLDGGGSCHLQEGSKIIKKSERKNASWVLVYLKKDSVVNKPIKHICIDCGHGLPKDSGAVGAISTEAETVKYIGERVAKLLCVKGLKVTLNNSYMTLQERCIVANNAKCDYFVSVHCNSADNKTANGVETFVYSLGDKKTMEFAKCIHDEISAGRRDRGIKKGNFTVLTNTKMPACLLELGFISNTEEEKYILENVEVIANRIVDGILKALGE